MRIVETPAFAKVKETSAEARQPIIEVLRAYPKEVLLAMGARFAENGAFYIYSAFVLTANCARKLISQGESSGRVKNRGNSW